MLSIEGLFYVTVFYACLMYAHPHVKSSGLKDKSSTETIESPEGPPAEPVEEGKVESYTGVLCNKYGCSENLLMHRNSFLGQ